MNNQQKYTEAEIRDLIIFEFDKWSDDDIQGKSDLFDGTYPTVAVRIHDQDYGVYCGDFDEVDQIFEHIENANFDNLLLANIGDR